MIDAFTVRKQAKEHGTGRRGVLAVVDLKQGGRERLEAAGTGVINLYNAGELL